jgi:hypothetical protein
MLIAEDLLLLLTDDESGKPVVETTELDLGLAGAVLIDLAELDRVEVAQPGETVKEGRLYVRDRTPTGEAVLDDILGRLEERGPKKPASLVPHLTKGLREALYERLAERGIVRAEEGRVLGIFPRRQWPATDSTHEDEMRRGLHDVLVVGREPTVHEAMLVSMLYAVEKVPKVLDDADVDKHQVRERAKAIAEGEFAGEAVRKAVEAVRAAVFTSVIAATVVNTGST